MAQCAICSNESNVECEQCHSINYCSEECQEEDNETHKLLCSEYARIGERPSDNHWLSILFPAGRNSPRLVWLECTAKFEEGMYHEPKYGQLLRPHRRSEIETQVIEENPVRKLDLVNKLIIHLRRDFRHDGSFLNQCIRKVTTDPLKYPWKGDVLVTQVDRYETSLPLYEDMNLQSFRDIVDFSKSTKDQGRLYDINGLKCDYS